MNLRTIIAMLSLSLGLGYAHAEDGLTVRDVIIAKDGKAVLAIEAAFESNTFFGYQLEVVLPKGISISLNGDGKPMAESHTALDITGSILHTTSETTSYQFVATKMGNPRIPAGSYVLLTMPLETDGSLDVGDAPTGAVRNIIFSDGTQSGKTMPDIDFTVNISDVVVLDENSPVIPLATDDEVDILVKRTITANEWSTLCLPFDMTEQQVHAAFGPDAELAEFDSYEVDDDGNIAVYFIDTDLSDGIYGNWPYIIRTSKAIADFEVHAQIAPDEESAVCEYQTGSGKKKRTVGTFTGTLHAGVTIPNEHLFLSSNNFCYSVGKTKCKAFRAYFWFEDVLPDLNGSASRIAMSFADNTTAVGPRSSGKNNPAVGIVYDLQGRGVKRPAGGIYIKSGKIFVEK